MKLEHQVCSVELAKRLEELGVKQESAFYWDARSELQIRPHLTDWYDGQNGADEIAAAFTVAELGEMLPRYIDKYESSVVQNQPIGTWELVTFPEHNGPHKGFHVRYIYKMRAVNQMEQVATASQPFDIAFTETTEADARAKMLIYLLENKLL